MPGKLLIALHDAPDSFPDFKRYVASPQVVLLTLYCVLETFSVSWWFTEGEFYFLLLLCCQGQELCAQLFPSMWAERKA